MSGRYQVKEIFGPTVQGEGPNQGKPCVFLRFSGCNAWDGRAETRAASACPYCDTDFLAASLWTAQKLSPGLKICAQSGLVRNHGVW